MKTRLVIFMLCLLLIPVTSHAAKKKLVYSDETYKVYQQKGKLSWVEIRIKHEDRGEPVYYIPRKGYTAWEKVVVVNKKGYFSADIFYLDLPSPFSLLLPMDMIYINMIIHYPEKSAFIVYLNHADPIYFIRILLDKVKNV